MLGGTKNPLAKIHQYLPHTLTNQHSPVLEGITITEIDDTSMVSLSQSVTPLSDFVVLQQRYPNHKKVMSVALLGNLGLPVLPGFVVSELSNKVLDFLSDWAHRNGFKRVSIRFDSTSPQDNIRLMGANPTMTDLHKMRTLVRPPVIMMVMAANDRFAQGYSIITTFAKQTMTCEIVGPGFDASDLTRGQVNRHESFTFWRKDVSDDAHRELRPLDVVEHTIISQEGYVESLEQRYSKIFAIIEKGLGHAVNGHALNTKETEHVQSFLRRRGAPQLPNTYTPIGFEKLSELYGYLSDLDVFHNSMVTSKTLSASFLLQHGLVFWDLYGSDKYMQGRQFATK